MTELKILVVGTGRCGTGYLANRLTLGGIPCGHEAIFCHCDEDKVKHNYITSPLMAEAAWPSAPFIGASWFDPAVKIIHLLRNPQQVIKSFYDLYFFSEERAKSKPLNRLVYQHTTIRSVAQNRLFSSVRHYYEWNSLISARLAVSSNPSITVKLEDLLEEGNPKNDDLKNFLGLELPNPKGKKNEKVQEKILFESTPMDNKALLNEAKSLASKFGDFGYELE